MAKRLFDQILVVDVEATCWEGTPPRGEESEIIEIGICLLDIAVGHRLEKQRILVAPERSTVSTFCTQLTGLVQEEVKRGIAFAEACSMLNREYHAGVRVWASYGDYDRQQFEKQCRSYGIAYPFGPSHVNVKTLFTLLHGLSSPVGMAKALEILLLPLEGKHHRADDDAWNIAGILAEILKRYRTSVIT